MPRAIIAYGSTTGNTELLAGYIAQGLHEAGVDVTVLSITEVDVEELLDYDLIFLGSSTWGEGELQEDMISFYDDMEGLSLRGKKAAAFGPGDSSYDMFCEAVNLLEDRLRLCGAKIISQPLKIDGDVIAAEDAAKAWGRQAATVRV